MRHGSWCAIFFGAIVACASTDSALTGSTSSRLTTTPEVERATGVAVAVEWDFAPTWKGAFSTRTTIPAHLSNTTSSAQNVHLYLTASGLDQRTVRRSLGNFSIPAASGGNPGTLPLNVSVTNLPVQSTTLQSEAELEAVWNENLSNQLTAASSAFYYVFNSTYTTMTSYAYDGVDFTLTSANSGVQELADIQASADVALSAVGRYVNVDGGWTTVNIPTPPLNTFKTLQTYQSNGKREYDIIAADVYDNLPVEQTNPASGPNSYKLCTSWHVQFEDANSYYTNFVPTQPLSNFPSAYSRYWISYKLGGVYHWAAKGYLDSSGCSMPVALDPNSAVLLWQETTLKSVETQPIDVFYGGWNPQLVYFAMNPWSLTGCSFNCIQSGDVLATGLTVQSVASTTTVNVTTTAFGLAANGAATVGAALRTPGLVTGISGFTPHMKVFVNLLDQSGLETGYYVPQPANPGDSNYGVWLSPAQGKPHNSRWETIIAHELGHYVNDLKSGLSYFTKTITSANVACRCDQVSDPNASSHCLQSAIDNGFATNEGFAHFFAAQALQPLSHTACTFGYYKEFREDTAVIDLPPVVKSCSSAVKWGQNHACTDSTSAVEWDWLDSLWSVRTDPSAAYSMDDFAVVWRQACGNPNVRCNETVTLTPSNIRQAATTNFGLNSPKATALNADFTANGI